MLFKGFPNDCDALKSLKNGALSTVSSSKWSTEGETYALPLVNQVNSKHYEVSFECAIYGSLLVTATLDW